MESKEEMRKNVDSAIKVHELEGFKFTEEELAVFDRIANLEITTEEAREIFREKLAGKKRRRLYERK
ncbi:antitoxin VbhA family protein [Selenomonas sp. CM52]|uniref:antitoxin VbhA family protein n=1 Tax=Selenomonas sp. CM52 TaxID=936381 RepID=UPI0005668176|nr:antitoxin VbhA family protein [Selenomonas sp. CM52]